LICNSPDKADQLLAGLDTRRILDANRSAARLSALIPTAHADDWATLQQNETYKAAKKLVKTLN
jgi:beta-N-acetylhexosaminidase